jgi:hypothetical protein
MEAVAIVECDVNRDILVAWSYPSVTPELEKVVIAQAEPFISHTAVAAATTAARKSVPYFTRFGRSWLYGCVAAGRCSVCRRPSLCLLACGHSLWRVSTTPCVHCHGAWCLVRCALTVAPEACPRVTSFAIVVVASVCIGCMLVSRVRSGVLA